MEGYKTNYRVLIADDDPNVHQSLSPYFRREGYEIFSSYDGEDAVEKARSLKPDMIILDIMMPRKDGLAVCREIRREANIPVIMLSAKGEEFDKLLGLELGADDYITKPFNPLEVLARVKAQLRRYAQLGGMPEKSTALTLGGIAMDDERKSVTLDGEEVTLTPTEYDILRLLLENPGKVFSSADIYRRVWKDEPFSAEGTVPVHIRHLREKLEIDPANPRYLKVVWGKGYKLEEMKK